MNRDLLIKIKNHLPSMVGRFDITVIKKDDCCCGIGCLPLVDDTFTYDQCDDGYTFVTGADGPWTRVFDITFDEFRWLFLEYSYEEREWKNPFACAKRIELLLIRDDLIQIKDRLASGWCQGFYAKKPNGDGCSVNDGKACSWCLGGAFFLVDERTCRNAMRWLEQYEPNLVRFNDSAESVGPVLALLDKGIDDINRQINRTA